MGFYERGQVQKIYFLGFRTLSKIESGYRPVLLHYSSVLSSHTPILLKGDIKIFKNKIFNNKYCSLEILPHLIHSHDEPTPHYILTQNLPHTFLMVLMFSTPTERIGLYVLHTFTRYRTSDHSPPKKKKKLRNFIFIALLKHLYSLVLQFICFIYFSPKFTFRWKFEILFSHISQHYFCKNKNYNCLALSATDLLP